MTEETRWVNIPGDGKKLRMPTKDKFSLVGVKRLLIVEGKEDLFFLAGIVQHLIEAGEDILPFMAKSAGGATEIPDEIEGTPQIPGYQTLESIAVLRDADDNPRGSRESVLDAFARTGLLRKIRRRYTAIPGTPRVSVFLLPDDEHKGALETACMNSALTTPQAPCIDEFLRCADRAITRKQPQTISQQHKSWAYAFLATTDKPEDEVSEACWAGTWDITSKEFIKLIGFLRTF